ncbi:uncharacterized protein [Oryctolagus cuniculus]|uniref:uncharacterized protein n=1 Tax=Oryctolagus cuniculus TaxID=9986 RepID=UPI00387A0EB2
MGLLLVLRLAPPPCPPHPAFLSLDPSQCLLHVSSDSAGTGHVCFVLEALTCSLLKMKRAGQTGRQTLPSHRLRHHMGFQKPPDVPGMLRNEEVGYSQGLSHVVALLLMYMPKEDSFWALVQLMENSKHTMHAFLGGGSNMGMWLILFGFLQTEHPKTGAIPAPPERYHASRAPLPGETPGEGGCVPGGLHRTLVHPGFPGWGAVPPALRMWDIYILEGEHVLTTMAYTALKIHHKCLLKMSRDHIHGFLQLTLKQAWSLSEDVVIRQLRASMRELGKLQCLLPPEAKAIKRCGRPLGQAHVPQKHVPAPSAMKAKIAIQDTVAVWEQTRGPAARAVMIHPPESFGLRIAVREGIEEEESCEGSPEPLGLGSPVWTAESTCGQPHGDSRELMGEGRAVPVCQSP